MLSLTGHHSPASSHRYQRHQPENTSLYPIVEQHLPTLRSELQHHETSANAGASVPLVVHGG
jgi:hypothetical protein